MNTKHTPGPWRVSKSVAGYTAIYHGEAGNMIAALGASHGTDESASLSHMGNAKANAALIAAAPDLLAALRGLLHEAESFRLHERGRAGLHMDRARAAIAKANP